MSKERSLFNEFVRGTVFQNPIFVLMLGLCPALGVTTSITNSFSMGAAVLLVLLFTNTTISIVGKYIPREMKTPGYILIIASFVTIAEVVMKAYFYETHKALGIFVPLMAVNCIILNRAQVFADRNSVLLSIADGIGAGTGFTLALMLIGGVREVLGNGTLFGIGVMSNGFQPALIMSLPAGAFLTVGFLMAVINVIKKKAGKSEKRS